MENYDNAFGPMDPNFSALFDAAQDARKQIAAAIANSPDRVIGGTQFCNLEVGDTVNFRAHILYASNSSRPDISDYATNYDRDCTVEEIRDCAARVVAQMQQSAREARIEKLEAELAKLKAEEGE